jgi:Ca2+-binding RTX toxin-like protein
MTLAVSRPLLIAAALGSLLAFPAGAGAVGAFPGGGGDDDGADAPALSHGVGERDFDVRAREARTPEPPPPSLGAARADLRRQLGRQGVLDLDPVTGTPRIVARLDGFLTGPSAADPAGIALGFVGGNLAAFGLDEGDLGTLRLADRRTDGWGITHLAWSQEFRGVPSLDSGLKAAVDEQGRLINITGPPQPDLAVRETKPDFGAPSALALAQRAGGESVALPPVTDRPGGPERVTEFGDGSDARLVLFAEDSDQLRLAWRVLNVESGTEIYDTVVDASTGETLKRENIVNFASGQAWEYFPNSDNDALGLVPAQGSNDGGGPRALKAFPAGWGTPSTALFGNFAHVYTDVNDNANGPSLPDTAGQCGPTPQACGDIPPTSGADWNYPHTVNPDGTGGLLADCFTVFPVCTWGDAFTPFDWNYNIGQNGTQVYYFVSKFHDWLAAAPFNFAGAEGFEGADKVNAQIFDGAASDTSNPGTPDENHLNNANMATFPGADTPPRMQMYLFSGIPLDDLPEVNGGDDASVIYHEYAHGLSNRLVNFTLGQSALNGFQADSMGEGWSDWYAMDFLEANNIDEDDREGPPSGTPGQDNDGEMNVGIYTFGGDIHNLRTMGLDCAPGTSDIDCDNPAANQAGSGGYTYGDMGKILCPGGNCFPEVHADGEIWAQAIWDLRQVMRSDTVIPFDDPHDAGLDRVRAIVTEGMRLSPPNPSFLDMRNAIIQADQALFGGADVGTIWNVFAGRGMGYFAASLGTNDTSPVQDFSTPPNCSGGGCGTLSGRVTETESGDAVPNAIVEILGPGNLFDQADANGNYSIANVPAHTYPYIAVSAAGYEGGIRTNVNVGAGGGTLNLNATRDWAALSGGASVTAFSQPDFSNFGCGPAGAFDLSLASGWGSTSPNSSQGPGGQKSVTVRLPRKVDITTFAIDPGATCGDDDSASTGGWEILTSETGSAFQRAAQGNFVAGNNHHLNEITPSGNAGGIQFVRFVMRTPQLPNTPGSSGADFMDVSEVEVWGRPSSAGPGPGGPVRRCAGRRATKVGTAGRNTIIGTNRRDVIAALGGNDRVRGRGGNDLICLGAGKDNANGGAGKDDIRGEGGNDVLSGAGGNDKLNGGGGRDKLNGGGGRDRLIGGGGRDTCVGNAGRDSARSCERRRSI